MAKNNTKKIIRPANLAIVVSRFNEEITQRLLMGAQQRLQECAVPADHVTVVWVPGAVEIPLIAQCLARKKQYAAIICLGAVIRGETSHYDYVCDQVSTGCQKVALENNLPVIFGILTTARIQEIHLLIIHCLCDFIDQQLFGQGSE